MEGDAVRVVLGTVHTGTTVQLLHLGTRARSTSEVGVTANRCEGSRRTTSSEVVIWDGLERRCVTVFRAGSAVSSMTVTGGLMR